MAQQPIHSIYDSSGRAVVNMVVTEGDNLLDTYSDIDGIDIDSSVATYILDHSSQYPSRQAIMLNIISSHLDSSSIQLYQSAIARYFSRQWYVATRSVARHTVTALLLAIAGIIGFALLAVARNGDWHELVIMFVEIFVWVCWWECVDVLFIHTIGQMTVVARLKTLSNITVQLVQHNQ